MLIRCTLVCSAVLGVVAFQGTSAHALSMHECSAKYQAAKTAGTLNGMKWNEFRKIQCGAEATAVPTTAAAPPPLPAPLAHALSMHECSAKYQAAKSGGSLNGMKWNEFRKTQCGAEAMAAPPPSSVGAPAPLSAPTRSAAPVAVGNAVFPRAIDPRYSSESVGKARRETCLEQYNANKVNNANGGLKWIQRGGGYYSECNRRLKGQA